LHFLSKQISGFPFRLDAVFKNLEIDIETPHGPSSWKTDDFALHRLTYGAEKTLFEAAGRQRLSWTDAKSRSHEVSLAVGSLRASTIESDSGLQRFDLAVVSLNSADLSAENGELHLRKEPGNDAIDLFVVANEMRLGPKLLSAFGRSVEHALLSAKVL